MKDINPPNNLNGFGGRSPEETLRLVSYCPVCHYHYNPVEAKVLEENDGAHLVYIKCRRCRSAILALIMANNFGISSVGLITDLDSYEVTKFKDIEAIGDDDVLELYEKLAKDQFDLLLAD